DRTGAGDHDDIVELDVAARDGVNRTRERLDDRGILERHVRRYPVHDRRARDAHELRHAAVGHVALEAEDVVHFAHPVLAGAAVAASLAGNDLLGDDALAQRNAEMLARAVAKRLDVTEELVTWNHRRLDPGIGATPEHFRARPAFAVARADAAGADANHHFARTRDGPRELLHAIVLGRVADDRRHSCIGAIHGAFLGKRNGSAARSGALALAVREP